MNGRLVLYPQYLGKHIVSLILTISLVISILGALTMPVHGQEARSYDYTVEEGDSWDIVAAKTDVPVEALKEANPDAVRESGWLLVGETLSIPFASQGESIVHEVGRGESWSIIADQYGISAELLRAANQRSVRQGNILFVGEKLTIPPAPSGTDADALGEAEELLIADPFADEDEPAEAEEADFADADTGDVEADSTDAEGTDAEGMDAEVAAEDDPNAAEGDAPTEDEPVEDTELEGQQDEETIGEEDSPVVEEGADVVEDDVVDEEGASEDDSADEASAGMEDEAAEEALDSETEEGDVEETPVAEDETDETEAPADDATEPGTEADTEAEDEPAADDEDEAETPETDQEDVVDEPVDEPADELVDDPIICPETLIEFPQTVLAVINADDATTETLAEFLAGCGSNVEDSVTELDIDDDAIDELVVVYQNPSQESTFIESDLIILAMTDEGYEVAYRARAAGEVRLVTIEDINQDGMIDVVWIDTTCGASTCFDTVNVRSWDGSVWADWTDGTITMAYADIELADGLEGGGQSIQLTGGIYGSVGAGPQRSRTELWASVDGMPYTLTEKTYSESECLYHTVVDANRAFEDVETEGYLASARSLYEKAVTDDTLIKCWVRPNELDELRSFSLFRLGLLEAYDGDLDAAQLRFNELSEAYPESTLIEAADIWLEAVEDSGELAAGCEAVTEFAQDNPDTWEMLSDYGYTNPSFDASDLCPPPGPPGEDADESALEGATGESPLSDPGANSNAVSDDITLDTSAEEVAATKAISGTVESPGFPDCPATLADYALDLPEAIALMEGDPEKVAQWMTLCGSLSEDEGAIIAQDLNGDGIEDFALFPTIISDVGLGPDGAQGAVHILHSMPDGDYELVASPEIYGEPTLLSIGDLNDDGRLDMAWTVEGCSTFCVLDTQIISWNGESYEPLIQPGAAIAEGSASFEPVADDSVGGGQSLIISGGVSGTPEGGLTVAHEEVWQSIDGQPYRRVTWQYDRTDAGSDCMGLRMIEADVALQSSDALGYEPAIQLYNESLRPQMLACSIFGLRPDEELELLQGLASFRLIQSQAYSGDLEGAQSSADLLVSGMPDSIYSSVAQTWLAEYVRSGSAANACEAITPTLAEYPELWQITDHFGYNHPALASQQICFMPSP